MRIYNWLVESEHSSLFAQIINMAFFSVTVNKQSDWLIQVLEIQAVHTGDNTESIFPLRSALGLSVSSRKGVAEFQKAHGRDQRTVDWESPRDDVAELSKEQEKSCLFSEDRFMSHQLDGHAVGCRHLESPGWTLEKTIPCVADNFYSKISLVFSFSFFFFFFFF